MDRKNPAHDLSFTSVLIMKKAKHTHTHMQSTMSTYSTCTHAELTLGWPVSSRGPDLPLLNTELVVSLHWWGCQQLPVHPARSRVMDCVIPCCWHCSRPEVEYAPPTNSPPPPPLSCLSVLPPLFAFSSFSPCVCQILNPLMCTFSFYLQHAFWPSTPS